MEDDLNFIQIEDDLNFVLGSQRSWFVSMQPYFDPTRWNMEDNLNIFMGVPYL